MYQNLLIIINIKKKSWNKFFNVFFYTKLENERAVKKKRNTEKLNAISTYLHEIVNFGNINYY